ncbi:MAG: hypothetical protein AW10_03524 [Candidatus Accumulibacter appositus]|uniref:DUF2950 domain-containing protein n=1 Tax=Candidatus Accumulibacter appositus TaxID=1454003 RepID=A0A011NR26_9PROT|nr:DUF2950 domain-containing protein [Accumulibacter sp.]EXI77781.1 MAG: hypothetical protein AW10_03524 [Candidatus Accumulibacter appositus]HRF05659.1 DUF2950 domain-containing protein [Accumulibacter sp.]
MTTLKPTLKTLAVALLIATAPAAIAAAAAQAVATQQVARSAFAKPDDAALALAEAVRSGDPKALLAVVGPNSGSWLFSGDKVADREDWKRFLAAYDQKHSISEEADGKAVLIVGDDDWPFPAPLVRKGGGWVFDAEAGREEITNRRIGRNELDTVQTLLAIVDAQRDYATEDLDGNGFNDYARRFVSTKDKRDGLYWPVEEGQPLSPLGPLISDASDEGYTVKQSKNKRHQPTPYHGYLYRMLTAEGKNSPDGAYNYLVGDKMFGGFAVVAYPAKYGTSGVMTFLVNHNGIVYQKDLGNGTASAASAMRSFNPDTSWSVVH